MALMAPDWGRVLAGLGQGLMQAGQPGGNFGQGLMQGTAFYDQGVDNRRLREMQEARFKLDQEQADQQRLANTQAAEADRRWQEFVDAHSNPAPGQMQTASGPGLMNGGGLTADQWAAIGMLPRDEGQKLYAQQAFDGPDPLKAPPTRTRDVNGQTIQEEMAPDGTWKLIGARPTFAPQQGAQEPERVRLAKEAGLVPGTPQYTQFLLGRDDTPTGPFQGTGLDQQSYNIVLTGDPSTSAYAAAYTQLAQPKTTLMPDGTIQTVSPDMSWARKPMTSAGAGQALADPAPGQQSTSLPGATVTTVPGSGVTPQDRLKLRSVKAEATAIKESLTRFKQVVNETGPMDRASAVTGGLTEGGRKLNSAWTNAAIMTKAEALFNLGVLNGPDLSVIQGTLPNPSTLSGSVASDEAYNVAIDEVMSLIDSKVASFEAQYGGTPYTRPGNGAPASNDPLGIR